MDGGLWRPERSGRICTYFRLIGRLPTVPEPQARTLKYDSFRHRFCWEGWHIAEEDKPADDLIRIQEGLCYVVKERKPFLAYKLFESSLSDDVPGLCVTRQFPEKVREAFELKDTRILWLSHTPGKDHHNPTSIGTLATVISSFIERYKKCVVLIDGLEYLVINNGFQQVLRFVEHINEQVMQSRSTVLIPISPNAFSEKELALLERNVEAIDNPTMSISLEKDFTTLIDQYR